MLAARALTQIRPHLQRATATAYGHCTNESVHSHLICKQYVTCAAAPAPEVIYSPHQVHNTISYGAVRFDWCTRNTRTKLLPAAHNRYSPNSSSLSHCSNISIQVPIRITLCTLYKLYAVYNTPYIKCRAIIFVYIVLKIHGNPRKLLPHMIGYVAKFVRTVWTCDRKFGSLGGEGDPVTSRTARISTGTCVWRHRNTCTE